MHARREDPLVPAWSGDQLDSLSAPEIEAPYFDVALKAWVLSRHVDILAALRTSSLCPASPKSTKMPEPTDEHLRLKMRSETLAALSPQQLRKWQENLAPDIARLTRSLPLGRRVDLLAAYAKPLCLYLAAIVTGISRESAEELCEYARRVSANAAEPYDAALHKDAQSANDELRKCFHSGPEALRDSSFVALSQTMPCILGNAWFALLKHPRQWGLLHKQPELVEQAIEELMRYAGLVPILARIATEDLNLNGCFIRKGERIILRIVAGNRDPDRFFQPDELDVTRRVAGSFALGVGAHSCVGASLIRMAAVMITRPLVQRFSTAHLASPVEWQGGSGFRSPSSLWVEFVNK
jgi:cytochrome P450